MLEVMKNNDIVKYTSLEWSVFKGDKRLKSCKIHAHILKIVFSIYTRCQQIEGF